jgi:hypothetical protein
MSGNTSPESDTSTAEAVAALQALLARRTAEPDHPGKARGLASFIFGWPSSACPTQATGT